MTEKEYPTAWATLKEDARGNLWVVKGCPYCGRKHTHGAGKPGEDPRDYLSHRVAHCLEGKGYILKEARHLVCRNTKAGRKADGEHYKRCMEQEGIPYLSIRVTGKHVDIVLDVITFLTAEEQVALNDAAMPYFLSGAAFSFSISPDLCSVIHIRTKEGMKLVGEWADILATRYKDPLPIPEQDRARGHDPEIVRWE